MILGERKLYFLKVKGRVCVIYYGVLLHEIIVSMLNSQMMRYSGWTYTRETWCGIGVSGLKMVTEVAEKMILA